MNETVLIVDDSLTVRMDLSEAFEAAAYRPVLCGTAREARNALAHEAVDLVLLDVLLPDGNGVELLKEIRRNPATSKLPIVMLSSESEIKDRIRGLQTGANDYIGKPYDTGYVLARGRELIAERQTETSTPQNASVLVIDDSTTFREQLREALEEAGYRVLTSPNGEEGLRVAAREHPSAVIVDGIMPGIDGITVIRRIRLDAALRGTPCLLLTASEDFGAELRALDAGADVFVRKGEDIGIVLARLGAALRSANSERPTSTSLVSPKRILAVDDSNTYLQVLSATLRSQGYEVVLAHSGEEAIDMLSVQSVDCILLDLMMPQMDGKETCSRIKGSPSLRDIPIIMITALEDHDAMIEGLSTGADDYICKSNDFDVLNARVQAQLRRKQFEDENRRIREELLRSELIAAEERAARQIAETRASLVEELERKNGELEAFSYSVSHDLRAPLRSIAGFSHAVLEGHASGLDAEGRDYLQRVCGAAKRMSELIDDLLLLSRVGRAEFHTDHVNMSKLAEEVVDELRQREPQRQVHVDITPSLVVEGDSHLLRILLDNLIGNAWKFSAKSTHAKVELGCEKNEQGTTLFVRDNGAGFDMAYVDKLFRPFRRLHTEEEFPGTGIGLATVYRIVNRHGGRVWAEGELGQGTTIYFTISTNRPSWH